MPNVESYSDFFWPIKRPSKKKSEITFGKIEKINLKKGQPISV